MNKRTFLILFLITFSFIGFITFLERSTTYIGKKGIEASAVENLESEFMQYLYEKEGLKLTKEELLAKSPVTEDEIENYRTYYGTMQEQIANIKEQYQGASEEELKVRDKKIAEISANFQDDEVVRKKVLTMKEKAIENYLIERYNNIVGGDKNDLFNYTVTVDGEVVAKENNLGKVVHNISKTYAGYNDQIYLSVDEYIPGNEDSIAMGVDINVVYPTVKVEASLLDRVYKDTNYGDEIETFQLLKYVFYAFWVLTLAAIIYLVVIRKKVMEEFTNAFELNFNKVTQYFDLKIVIALCMLWASKHIAISQANIIQDFIYNLYYRSTLVVLLSKVVQIAIHYVFIAATVILIANIVQQWRNEKVSLESLLFTKCAHLFKEAFYKRSIGWQMVILAVVFACAGFGIAVVMMQPVALLVYIPLFVLIVVPTLLVFLQRFAFLNRIMKHTEALANGYPVEVLKVNGTSPLSEHARNINKLQQGVMHSVKAQAKSERLKTELITNVSHDLRTPLTSIITYTDLLKAETLTDEERSKYVAILENKSQRLKQLIEDLFEVSKMASGNMEIHRQQIDITQLLQQIIAEHEEDFSQEHLALRVTMGEQPIFANVDPQKWWRVYDNLILNARKYSLPNTRVYISLHNEGGRVQFVIKNVTKFELGENVEELTERFKRGDTSRHTDGSGLGLAIAQSIVDIHGGHMKIELHGDLFQVTVTV